MKVKAREGIENIIMKNVNDSHSLVREGVSRRNMSRILQTRVSRKSLNKEFSSRNRSDSCGAVRFKKRKKRRVSKLVGDVFDKMP